MKKQLFFALLITLASGQLSAHCQIPCGIYHDQMVVQGMEEDVETLKKCVNEINGNPRKNPEEYNQLVRWVINKEKHADKLADTIVEYFLKQRIKPDAENLQNKLVSAHKVLVLSMNVKQTVSLDVVKQLNDELHTFIHLMYPDKEE